MGSNPVLVTGGAGYIGSHVALALQAAGRDVVVLDNLSTGRRELVPTEVPLIVSDVADIETVTHTLHEHGCNTVMHFAGSIIVAESVAHPLKYYHNNTAASRSLLEACIRAGTERFIFSSTAAVYGSPEIVPVPETAEARPVSPYGTSKLMTEWMLRDVAAAHGLHYAALRYFNVAGADPDGHSGQAQPEATHLIKVACQAAVGLRERIEIYGTDYPTPDGTCIRDYIHVTDLAEAHVAALDYLEAGGASTALNCGYGRGASVREVLAAVERACGRDLPVVESPRRPGDPPKLVADAGRIREVLAWQPRFADLDTIVRSALAWEHICLHESSPARVGR